MLHELSDPLLRFRLFWRGEDRFILMKAVHHIISDAMSTFTFLRELLEVYEAIRRGEQPALPPVQARYLDFLNWQNRFLAGPGAALLLDVPPLFLGARRESKKLTGRSKGGRPFQHSLAIDSAPEISGAGASLPRIPLRGLR